MNDLNNEIENEDTIQKAIRKALFKKFNSVYSGSITYDYLASIPEFWLEYPTLFVNFDDLKNLSFIIFWISGFCTVCLLCLYQPFMDIWVRDDL